MADLRRLPLAPTGWAVRATGGEGSPIVGSQTLDVAPFTQVSIHAVLTAADLQSPWTAERAELDSEWVGKTEWTFTREVDVPARSDGAQCALRIEILDGPCEIALGGVVLGSHMSEHVPFDARIPDALRGTRTTLELRFKAPVTEVLRWQAQLGERPVNGDWTPFCFSRSAACSFGWDWGPRVPGVGFYGARFDCWDTTRVLGVSVAQRWNSDGTVTVRVTPQGESTGEPLVCVVRERMNPKHVACDANGEATLQPAKLWSTWDKWGEKTGARGSNDGCWWNAMVGRRDATGAFKPIATTRFALRRIELDTANDDIGRRFRFILNGEPVFARGANIIPPLLGTRHERDWFTEMKRYRDTGFNMVRVWGGGNFLPDAFYEACDELGILVWQDFMFACATYPEDQPFASIIAREAEFQVQRLSHHPSLALWCGGNEDILAWWSWGWKDRLKPDQSWGRSYWLETLPAIVAKHDSGTPYWAESPYSGSMDLHPNEPDHGDRHTWDAEAKIEGYRTILPRFSSEFGHQSPPCLATLRREFPESLLTIGSAALALRQKAWGGDAFQYQPFLDARFAPARDFAEYHAQAQHLQARAMDVAMRWLRATAPRSMGALIWQWNDVWAGHSWSLIDVAGRAKPAWHAVRRACARRQLSIEPTGDFVQFKGGALEVVLSDDAAFIDPAAFAQQRAVAIVERVDFAGKVRQGMPLELVPHAEAGLAAATLRARIPQELLEGADPARELLVAWIADEDDLARAHWFLGDDASLELPEPALAAMADGVFRANSVIREFWIDRGDSAGADETESWRTLLPGDRVVIPAGARWWSANHFAKSRSAKNRA